LAFQVADRADRAVGRYGNPIDVSLIGRVEDLCPDSLHARRRQRFDRWERIGEVAGRDQLQAVRRARHGNELHPDAASFVPAQLRRNREGRNRRAQRPRAKADLHRRLRRRRGRNAEEQGQNEHCTVHELTTADGPAFSDASQKSTRRRMETRIQLSVSPMKARMNSTANSPATSMVKFLLWMSMPSPASAPTNSATIAPTSAKTMATSSPAMMKGSAEGRRSIQKICRSV